MVDPVDPVRERVEATLQQLVGTALTLPCTVVRTAVRVLGEPFALGRSVVNLAVDGLFGGDADSGVPWSQQVPTAVRTTAPFSADPEDDAPRRSAAAADLPIEGYEGLAASNIVARLSRLDRAALGEIRRFELANRGRRTVVGRIDQLLAQR